MNLGLKDSIKKDFMVSAIQRPVVQDQSVPHGFWMAGFMSGEGCFFVHARDTKKVSIYIKIAQHERDHQLIKSFVEYFGGGRFYKPSNENMVYYICESFSTVWDKIIPFFNKYPVEGVKALNFSDFVAIASLMRDKARARGPCKTQRASLI